MEPEKTCNCCGIPKPGSEFSKNQAMPDGLQRTCKQCQAEYSSGRRNTRMDRDREESRRRRLEKRKCLHRIRLSGICIQKMSMEQFMGLKLLRVYKSRDYVLIPKQEMRMSSMK